MTPEQIDHAIMFHENGCEKVAGPRGGVTYVAFRWHRNGQTRRWKREPDRFVIPVKYGLREHDQINPLNVERFHAAEACPIEELRKDHYGW